MDINNKLTASAICLVMLTAPALGAAACPRTKAHCRYHAGKPIIYPVRRSIDGDLVDRDGWRLRPNGWDNSCFNLPWLTSMYACGTGNGR